MITSVPVNEDMHAYYARRAHEYERIYEKPERQRDLEILKGTLPALLAGRRVSEVACGTGYWTQAVAREARSVVATDAGAEVLNIARCKYYERSNVQFIQTDAYALADVAADCDAGLAAFWISHVPNERLGDFLHQFHAQLGTGGCCVLLDNRYVAGSSTPLHRTDAQGNTYQRRKLVDGSDHEVLKNFPEEKRLRQALSGRASAIEYVALEYYWYVSYELD